MSAKRSQTPIQPPPRTGVVSVLTLITVVASIAVTATVLGLVAIESFERTTRLREQGQTEAKAVAASIRHQMTGRSQSLASIATDSAVTDALATGDRARLDELERRYAAAFPDAQALLITPRGSLRAAPNANPPIGYALTSLLDSFTGQVTMAVHRPGQSDSQLNMVASVRADESLLGHVIVLYPATVVTGDLTVNTNHPWELVQQHQGGGSVVARSGRLDHTGGTVSAAVPDTPWQVRLSPMNTTGPLAGAPLARVAIIIVGSIAVIILLAWLGARRLRQAIHHDAGQFHALVTDTARGQLGDDYPAACPELKDTLRQAAAEAREASQAPPPAGERTEKPPQPTAADAEPETADDEVAPAPRQADTSTAPEPARTPSIDEPLDFTVGAPDSEETADVTEAYAEAEVASAIDPAILRAYDIRGIVGETLTPSVMRALGQALGSEAADRDQEAVVVAYDGRHSSPELAAALSEGLVRAGRQVINVGAVPTPLLYFATHHLETQAGVMVTGSHNPPAYNGLKMIIGGETLSGDAIQALGGRLEAGNLVEGPGRQTERDIRTAYREQVTRHTDIARPQRVVVDAGNGIAGAVGPEILETLGCEVVPLFCDVDSGFPNHHPDPSEPSNLDQLIAAVREQSADLGIAFDGDGDRLGVVDNDGKIIWADRQLMLFAREVLLQRPGSDVVFDVKCTNRLPELITEYAGIPVMWKTGHSLIKGKLQETGAPLAGEMSGHFFFNDRWYGFDDGIYAAARLLEILAADRRPASTVFAELPEGLTTPELRLDLNEGEPSAIIDALVAGADTMGATRINTIDGLRVDFPDGWGLVRASNTQPCLVLRFEGDDAEALERIQAIFRERLTSQRPGIKLPF